MRWLVVGDVTDHATSDRLRDTLFALAIGSRRLLLLLRVVVVVVMRGGGARTDGCASRVRSCRDGEA